MSKGGPVSAVPSPIMVSDSERRSDSATRPLNARSLALSALLGTHPPVLPGRGLVALAELFGIPGGTMRTALSRMVAAGELVSEGGRYRLVGSLLDRQRSQDVGRRPPKEVWSGAWHTVIAIDERRPIGERRRFRAIMGDQRFGELRPDTWMRPANLPSPAPAPGWAVLTAPLAGDITDALVRRLWDLQSIASTAHSLRADLDVLATTTDWSDPAAIPVVFLTSASVVRFLRSDPMLPSELVGPDWPVHDVRASYDEIELRLQTLLRQYFRGHT